MNNNKNPRITEKIQKQIDIISKKLGSNPIRIRNYLDNAIQVNWLINNKSYMWRSINLGELNEFLMDWVEIYMSGNAHTSNCAISDL